MALVPQTVQLALGKLDTKTDSRWVVAGDLIASQNIRFDAWPKLLKRPGYGQLAVAASGSQLAAFKTQLLLGTGAEALSYAASGLIDKGVLESMTLSARPVRRDAFVQTTPDSAVHPTGTITVYTWETTAGGSQYAVHDTATGQPIVSGVSLGATAVKPKPFALGNYVVVLFYDTGSNKLRFIAIPVGNPTTSIAAADFAIDPATTQVFDGTVVSGVNGSLVVAYANNAGANKISLKSLSASLTVSAATVPTTTEVFNTCVAVFGDSVDNVWVAYFNGSALKLFIYDNTLSNRLLDFTTLDPAPGTVRNVTGIAPVGLGSAILYEVVGSAPYNNLVKEVNAKLGLSPPVNLPFTVGAGTLATGTYFYRVSALNADGETTPSDETSLAITGPAGVNVNWTTVAGATGYKVYGRSTGAELLIATVGAVTTFLDNGSITPSGAMPTSNTTVLTLTITFGPATVVRSVGLASKPFFYQGRVHWLGAYQSTLQRTYFLFSGSTVVGKLAPSVGGGLTAKSILPEVCNPVPGIFCTSYLQADQIGIQAALIFSQTGVMAGTFDFNQPQTAVELSDDLHLCGGILYMYDGLQVCEHGFHLYPENIVATPSGAGGSIETGTYQYVVTLEWMDGQGLLHQSAPSPAVAAVVTGPTGSVALTIPTLRLTSKTTPISVVVWRTQKNVTGPFFRLNSISAPLLNITTADTVAFTDTAIDTSISGNAQLYSNPLNTLAEIPNLAAPAPLHVWRYRNRVALIPAENSFQWMFSKAFVAGVPIEFNPQQLFQSVSQDGGPLTAGIEMDEKNILFTASRIYYMVGEGPAPNGTNSDYGSSPQNIPSDVGCINRRSVVLTPRGVMFQSAKGIYLLGRDLSVSYIGAGVEAFNSLTITAARLVPNSRRVLFFTNGGITLSWDYYAEKWSTWTNHAGVDAAVFGGLITYLKSSGQLWQEAPGQFTDVGAPILMSFTTAILSFAGLSGFQRVWRIGLRGDYRSPHWLQVGVAFDDSPAPLQVATVDAGTLLGTGKVADSLVADTENPSGGLYPSYEFIVKPVREKCGSLQITVQEAQTGPTYGEGLSISGMAFLVGKLPRLHPVPKQRILS